ncbi:hypothetical protein D9M71_767220 [compost metagenome]
MSSSLRTCGAVSASTTMSFSARKVISAWSLTRPAASIASFTAWNASGAVMTSMEPSSGYTTMSSAPASMAASVIFSSSAPGA